MIESKGYLFAKRALLKGILIQFHVICLQRFLDGEE